VKAKTSTSQLWQSLLKQQQNSCNANKAFTDIRLRPLPRYLNAASHALPYGPLWPSARSSIKPKYITYRNAAKKNRAIATGDLHTKCHDNWSSGSSACVPVLVTASIIISSAYAHGQTDRQTDRNTPLPYRGGVKSQNQSCAACHSIYYNIMLSGMHVFYLTF